MALHPATIGPRAGVMADVTATDDGWLISYRELGGPLTLLWFDAAFNAVGGLRLPTGSAEDSTFARVCTDTDGRQYVAYRVLRNGLWQLAVGEVTHGVYQNEVVLGRCFGNNPIVVDHEGHVAWQDDVAGCVYLWRIGTAPMGVITRREIRPTGLSRIDPLLGVRFIDEDRVLVPGMFNPVWAGACVVGEGQTGLVAQIGAVRGDVLPGECMVPRVAVRGDTYAAVTWGSPGVRVAWFTAADIPAAPVVEFPFQHESKWMGLFAFGPTRESASLPGNCRLLVPELLLVDKQGRTIAQYIASEGAGPTQDLLNLEAALLGAKLLRPYATIAYWTRQAQKVRVPAHADFMGIEAYWKVGETLTEFEAAMRAAVAQHPHCLILAQIYSNNTNNINDLVGLIPVYDRMRHWPNVDGIVGFSGIGRATGLQDHPEIQPAWTALLNSAPTPSIPIEETPMRPPAITVEKWTLDTLANGREAIITDRDNPELGYRLRVFIRDNSMYFEMTNRAGTGTTGQARPVHVAPGPAPTPPPTPIPAPAPSPVPAPAGDPYTTPTYEEWMGAEGKVLDAALGHAPSPEDGAHLGWRRLNEHWTVENMVRDMKHQPTIGLMQQQRVTTLTYVDWMQTEVPQLIAAIRRTRAATGNDLRHNAYRRFVQGWTLANMLHDILGEPLDPVIVVAPVSTIEHQLTTSGRIFLDGGVPWRWKGFSAFQLLDRFAKNEDLGPVLDAYAGCNIARVWPYVPAKDWGERAWGVPSHDTVSAFLDYMAARGLRVELTLLTDDDPGRIPWAQELVGFLASRGHRNLVLEIGNEPRTHKAIPTAMLRSTCESSGFPFSSGDYEDETRFFGTFGTTHPRRDAEWVRRAHDLLEWYDGSGPETQHPPYHVPWVADEPIKPSEAAGAKVVDFRGFFGACALMGAGATFHCETGKFAQLPTGEEAECLRSALQGLNAFPADVPNLPYQRIDEGGDSLRTYVKGNWLVRCRPATRNAPSGGWRMIDGEQDGVLWTR
jgi:hypothetical protein